MKGILNLIMIIFIIIATCLSSCNPKLTNVRTNNIVSYYKKGMHINTVDSLGSLNRVSIIMTKGYSGDTKVNLDDYVDSKMRHQFEVNFDNNIYKVISIGIVNEVREVERDGEKKVNLNRGDVGYNGSYSQRTQYSTAKVQIQIEDDLFLIFKDDKLENWVYLYELLNSPNEKDRKFGDLIASEYVKFKYTKRRE